MKRKIPIVLIIVLVIIVIVVSFKYRVLLDEHNMQQANLNSVFMADIRTASGSFGSNSLTKINGKYSYNEAISHIDSAIQLFQFTTYKNNNNGLQEPLDNLRTLMKREEYKEIIIQKSNLIHDELLQLCINPEDKQATENLVRLVEEIRQKE